jgi:hypothetical protein
MRAAAWGRLHEETEAAFGEDAVERPARLRAEGEIDEVGHGNDL